MLYTTNLSTLPSVSFKVWDKKRNLLPDVKACFLKEEEFDFGTESLNFRKHKNVSYRLIYDGFFADIMQMRAAKCKVLISYQQRTNGNYAIVRLLKQTSSIGEA